MEAIANLKKHFVIQVVVVWKPCAECPGEGCTWSKCWARNLLTYSLTYLLKLQQSISTPTRIAARSQTLIDLCFSSASLAISSSGTNPLTGSDHQMIYVTTPNNTKRHAPRVRRVRSFRKCDHLKLAEDLDSAPWGTMDTFDHIDDKWMYWRTLFLNIVNEHAPLIKVRSKKLSLKWINGGIRMLMRARNSYLTKFRKSKDPKAWECFRNLKNKIKTELKKAKKDYFEKVCTTFKHKSRRMWDEINKALGRKVKSGSIELTDGTNTITSPTVIANKLNTHFATCATPTSDEPNPPALHQVDTVFHFKPICENEVAASLALLNTHKSTGVDGISSHLLRTVAGALSPSITKLFNASLFQGQIPSEWKQANVTPIPKTSNSKSPSNFRPISVLPVILPKSLNRLSTSRSTPI